MGPTPRRDRDAGLRRVGSITRWTVAGALAGTGLFAGLAAQAGRAASTSSPKPVAARTAPDRGSNSTESGDDGGGGFTPAPQNTPPAVALAPPNAVAPIVSGAS